MLEQSSTAPAAAAWHAYPGMAFAQALALRGDEVAKKHGVSLSSGTMTDLNFPGLYGELVCIGRCHSDIPTSRHTPCG
jgi:hypothetical protein